MNRRDFLSSVRGFGCNLRLPGSGAGAEAVARIPSLAC